VKWFASAGKDNLTKMRGAWGFIVIFLLLAASLCTVGYFYYQNYENNYRVEAERQLNPSFAIRGLNRLFSRG
jgi:hypothetical protein